MAAAIASGLVAGPSPSRCRATSATTAVPTTVAPLGPVRVLVAGDSTAVQLSQALLPYAADHPDEVAAGRQRWRGHVAAGRQPVNHAQPGG